MSTAEPAPLRLAASVLLLRDAPLQVLMMERHAATVFGSALVFPGGGVEAGDHSPAWLPLLSGADGLDEQERVLRIAACRETFEETGLLLVEGELSAVPASGADFLTVVAQSGRRLALDALHRFAHWVTPPGARRRFDTHFYVVAAPPEQAARCDGHEAVSLEWLCPAEALASSNSERRHTLFPTRMNLLRLGQSASAAQVIAAALARPPFTVMPKVEQMAQGMRLTIPAAAGYGVTEYWPSVAVQKMN